MVAAFAVRADAIDDLENLKSEIKSLRKENESALAEVDKVKTDAEREKKSSMHAAATLAATNTARQAELEMIIEKMQKDVCLFGSTHYAQSTTYDLILAPPPSLYVITPAD